MCYPNQRSGRRLWRQKGFYKALSGNCAVGPRASVFSPGKAGDVGFVVDTAGCSKADNSVAFVQPLLRQQRRTAKKYAARHQTEFSDTA